MKIEAKEKLHELTAIMTGWLEKKKVGSITTNFFKGNICSLQVNETIKLSVREKLDQVIALLTMRMNRKKLGSYIVSFVKEGVNSVQTKETIELKGRKSCPCNTEEKKDNLNN